MLRSRYIKEWVKHLVGDPEIGGNGFIVTPVNRRSTFRGCATRSDDVTVLVIRPEIDRGTVVVCKTGDNNFLECGDITPVARQYRRAGIFSFPPVEYL